MTRKTKMNQTSNDPITNVRHFKFSKFFVLFYLSKRLKEAIYSIEKKYSENKSASDLVKSDCMNEENKRKKRRKSTPILLNLMKKSKYIESETDEEYFNFCNYDDNAIESNDFDTNIDNSHNFIDKYFDDDFNQDDDDTFFDDQRRWNLEEKLNIVSKYNSNFVKYLEAKGL